MNEKSFQVLELQKVKDQVAMLAITNEGKKEYKILNRYQIVNKIESWLAEISEAKEILKISRSVPIHGLEGMENILVNLNKGRTIRPSQFNQIVSFLDHCNKIKRFMEDKRFVAPIVSSYVESIEALPHLLEEIQRCIRHGQVDDYASKALLKVRKELKIEEERLKDKLQHIVGSKNTNLTCRMRLLHFGMVVIRFQLKKNIIRRWQVQWLISLHQDLLCILNLKKYKLFKEN
ncbi:hypothetical protein [Bacillus coahuilensis]|uniref:hypothetical protein n=1 Tax=Bacillus coahuilensis TaxID=408580 RepID=UPI0003027C40|nr:hypothetical protein [Bacillus coahuilensis]